MMSTGSDIAVAPVEPQLQPASLADAGQSHELAPVALKEWAVVCAALASGEQTVCHVCLSNPPGVASIRNPPVESLAVTPRRLEKTVPTQLLMQRNGK